MKKNKRKATYLIAIFILAVIVAFSLEFIFSNIVFFISSKQPSWDCFLKDGRMITFDSSRGMQSYCHITAKDTGNICQYNNECEDNHCGYSYPLGCDSNKTCSTQPDESLDIRGKCCDDTSDDCAPCSREPGMGIQCIKPIPLENIDFD